MQIPLLRNKKDKLLTPAMASEEEKGFDDSDDQLQDDAEKSAKEKDPKGKRC